VINVGSAEVVPDVKALKMIKRAEVTLQPETTTIIVALMLKENSRVR